MDYTIPLYNISNKTLAVLAVLARQSTKRIKQRRICRIFSSEPDSWNFLGITDVLYLENYEELRNLVFTSLKTVILTHKNIFWKTDS